MKKTLIAAILLFSSTSALAMTWGELNGAIQSAESGGQADRAIIQRLGEIIETVVAYTNSLRERDASSLLFCPPQDQQMTLDHLTSLIRAQARKEGAADDASVARLFIESLRQEYPCSQ